jgi:hypothetical protein
MPPIDLDPTHLIGRIQLLGWSVRSLSCLCPFPGGPRRVWLVTLRRRLALGSAVGDDWEQTTLDAWRAALRRAERGE